MKPIQPNPTQQAELEQLSKIIFNSFLSSTISNILEWKKTIKTPSDFQNVVLFDFKTENSGSSLSCKITNNNFKYRDKTNNFSIDWEMNTPIVQFKQIDDQTTIYYYHLCNSGQIIKTPTNSCSVCSLKNVDSIKILDSISEFIVEELRSKSSKEFLNEPKTLANNFFNKK